MASASPAAMSSRAAAAYARYRDLGPRRSIARLVAIGGGKQRTLERWCQTYGWVERAAIHDLEEARQVDPERVSLAMAILADARDRRDELKPSELRSLIASASMLLPPPSATPWQTAVADAGAATPAEIEAEIAALLDGVKV